MPVKLDDAVQAVRASPAEVRVGAVAGLVLLWVYWPTLYYMAARWGTDSRYSHGYIVPLFALYLLWARRGLLPAGPLQPRWWGLGLMLAGLAVRFAGTYLYHEWLATVALLPCLLGLLVVIGGKPLLRWAWPAVAFLLFMVPLPYRVEVALAVPLQRVATVATNYTLQTLGYVSFAEGVLIRMGPTPADSLNIAEACSGLSMLLVFFAIVMAVIIIINRRWYEKVLIFLSAVPIAVMANVVRLTMTGIILNLWGPQARDLFHDSFGAALMMMVLALVFLWIEVKLLSWILVPCTVEEVTVMSMKASAKAAPAPAATQAAPAETKKETTAPAAGKKKILPGLGLAVAPRSQSEASAPKGVQ